MGALSGAVAPPFFAFWVVVATLLTPGYSHRTQAISELAIDGSTHPWALTVGIVGYGLLVMPVALAIWSRLPQRRATALSAALMIMYGLGGVFAGAFPLGPLDASPEPMAWVHGTAARTAFAAVTTQCFLVPWLLPGEPGRRGYRRFSVAMGVLTIAFAVPFEAQAWPVMHGVLQRGFFLTTMAWVEVTSLMLFRPARR